jgi:hypothetical protein
MERSDWLHSWLQRYNWHVGMIPDPLSCEGAGQSLLGVSLSKPRIHKKSEAGVYMFIYFVILHGNNLLRMLEHHVLDRDW